MKKNLTNQTIVIALTMLLGLTVLFSSAPATQAQGTGTFSKVTVGYYHTCALTSGGG